MTEFKPGVVYEQAGVKVTAIEVDHGELLKQAEGTDLIVHQVAAVRDELLANPVFKAILSHHTKPDEAGIVFTRVKPKLAVYYHFVLLGTPAVPAVSEKDVREMTRKTYAGPLLIGEDLMAFRLDREQVVLLPAKPP